MFKISDKKISTSIGIIIIVSVAVVFMGGVFAYQHYKLPQIQTEQIVQLNSSCLADASCDLKKEENSCQKDDDCILAYVGKESCAPCGHSNPDIQCVSPVKAEELKNNGKQTFCEMCPTEPFLYKCVCKDNKCLKTAECQRDADCYTNYKCLNNKCTLQESPQLQIEQTYPVAPEGDQSGGIQLQVQ